MPTSITIAPTSNPNAVTGAASSIDNAIALFDSTTGKLLKDGGGLIVGTGGALRTTGIGTGTVAGNARGVGAVDLQNKRDSATQVASGANSCIGSGDSNTVSGAYSFVGSGGGNIASGSYSFVGGGATNTASGANAFIGGGVLNNATNIYSFVGGGYYAKADKYAQCSHAAGRFAIAGDAQSSVLLARKITTDATPTELFLDGTSARLVLANNTTWNFEIRIVGRRTDIVSECVAVNFQGLIYRSASNATTTLVPGNSKATFLNGLPWDATISADVTNGSLNIFVTGEAAKTIRWVARVTLVEVSS